MNIHNLLPHLIRLRGKADLTVEGVSMNPTLFAGDVVTIRPGEHQPGDILVFYYKGDALLIHRLLYIEKGRYFCKGDNAFRVEDVTDDQIVGRVDAVNGSPPELWPEWKIDLSRKVGREFRRCRYDIELTKQSETYKIYQSLVFKRKEETIMYQKNKALTYIFTDETSLAVFNPESGETHLLDEVCISILSRLEDPCDLESLLIGLCEEYEATPDAIRADVEEFLEEMIEKKVVILA